MGSEGYLVHQFVAARTNKRTDEWGGSFENRIRFALEIVRATREKVGKNFIIIFRISVLDLVEGGSTPEEVLQFARELEKAGVTILNSGIGWHEARIPTIGSMVPGGAFATVTANLRKAVKIPIVATNRINLPEIGEAILERGEADLVSMARPFLADPHFVSKAASGRQQEINTCIACNQACLDQIFQGKRASCLVNPQACEEKEWQDKFSVPTTKKKIAIVGAGPAGLSSAIAFLERGHDVTVFEKSTVLGGQFNLATLIPGKSDYKESIRYWKTRIELLGGQIILNHAIQDVNELKNFDHVILSSGVTPRDPKIPGQELPHVFAYDKYLREQMKPGKKVAIIGAGGIGFDVATYVLFAGKHFDDNAVEFMHHWGIDPTKKSGLDPTFKAARSPTEITLLQRSDRAFGKTLGKTTGWVHRAEMKRSGVKMVGGIQYEKITAEGLWIIHADQRKELIEADQIILCTGQLSENSLATKLTAASIPHTVIGGAKLASEIDAKRAIRDGIEIAFSL